MPPFAQSKCCSPPAKRFVNFECGLASIPRDLTLRSTRHYREAELWWSRMKPRLLSTVCFFIAVQSLRAENRIRATRTAVVYLTQSRRKGRKKLGCAQLPAVKGSDREKCTGTLYIDDRTGHTESRAPFSVAPIKAPTTPKLVEKNNNMVTLMLLYHYSG
ncbi:hypothetical protein C8Q69DRAFT_466852, partial [Paecilomyces variotii]